MSATSPPGGRSSRATAREPFSEEGVSNPTSHVGATEAVSLPAPPTRQSLKLVDFDFGTIARHPLTIPSLLVLVGLVLSFWPMIRALPARWNEDEYYSHGWLVPFLSAFIIFRRWPKIVAFARGEVRDTPSANILVRALLAIFTVAWTWGTGWIAYLGLGAITQSSPGFAVSLMGITIWFTLVAGIYGGVVLLINRLAGFQVAAGAILTALLPLVYAAYVGNILAVSSVLFVAMAILLVVVIAGWRWGVAFAPAIAFLLFGFPAWNWIIDNYTNPLQILSTQTAFALLELFGFKPFQPDATTIYLNAFTLDVGVPCSGMKLLLAVSAFTTLFVLIANLEKWANALMIILIIPLCLFVNGLRIALIGVVGDLRGSEAGHQFHDYSGYITLVVCFFLIFKFARLLGWKD